MNPILSIADGIFKKLQSIDILDRFDYLSINEEKFLKLYPIVAKHMCLGEYSRDVFNTIIKKQQETNKQSISNPELDVLSEFFNNQALYAKLLYKSMFKSKKNCEKIFNETLSELWKNRHEVERATKDYDENHSKILKSELIEFLSNHLQL
jgi:hypothetical protein